MIHKQKSMFAVFVFILIATAAKEHAYALGPNIVPNSSLETLSDIDVILPDSWFPDFWGTLSPVFDYPVPGHTGQAASVTVTDYQSGDAKWFFIPQPVAGAHTYTFSDFYKATVPTPVIVQFTMKSGLYRYKQIGVAPTSSTWRKFTTSFTTPLNATKISIFHIISSNGKLSVDDYSLADANGTPTPPPPPTSTITPTAPFPHSHLPAITGNLIANPSLETGTPGNPTDWFADSWGTNDPTFTYPVAGHTGSRAANVTIDSYTDGDAKWYFAKIPSAPNTDYVFSDYYKSDTKTIVIVQFTLASGVRNYIILDILPPASSWTKMEQTFNTPPNTAFVSVFHVINSIGSLTTDDASLQKLTSGSFSTGMISLSFDDNDLTFYTQAIPLLEAAGIKVSQNVPANFIDQAQKMTSDQLTSINKSGYEIDSHSLNHPFLTAISTADASDEINSSRTILLAKGFLPVTTFAYPFGDYNDQIESLVKNAGYTAARGTIPGFNTRNTDIYALHTQNVENDTTVGQVKQWVDYAIANNVWLILGFHEISDEIGTYNYQGQAFADILNYLKSVNANVVTTNTALLQMK